MSEENLIQKLAGVMGEVQHVAKNGRNDFHKYDYATEADIAAAVRDGMAKRGVMLIPSVERCDWRKVPGKNGEQTIATLTVKFKVTDGKDSIEFTILGEGQDSGDKATYKAMTGATKYALLKLFLIPTGDDPERDEGDKSKGQKMNRAASQEAAQSVRAATAGPKARKEAALAMAQKLGKSGRQIRADLAGILGRSFPESGEIVLKNAQELVKLEQYVGQIEKAAETARVLGEAQNGTEAHHG